LNNILIQITESNLVLLHKLQIKKLLTCAIIHYVMIYKNQNINFVNVHFIAIQVKYNLIQTILEGIFILVDTLLNYKTYSNNILNPFFIF